VTADDPPAESASAWLARTGYIAAGQGCARAWLFVSPHLDDAVLSCGALMEALAFEGRVCVATVFTEGGQMPWSVPSLRATARSGRSLADLFELRRNEDRAVLQAMSVEPFHLGFADGQFRALSTLGQGQPSLLRKLLARVPLYPTFRWDLARGRVAPPDRALVEFIRAELLQLVDRLSPSPSLVFAPLGVGSHVDHLLARDAAARLGLPTIYYSDFPYSEQSVPRRDFVEGRNLVPHLWLAGRLANAERVREYGSQLAGIFPDGRVPYRPEVYWAPATASATPA